MRVTRDGVDRSTTYLPEELAAITVALSAWDGDPGQGSIPIPDPNGNLEAYDGQPLLLQHDGHTILNGFVGGVTNERGATSVGPRQSILYAIGDDNALLHGHATTGWRRPRESPASRWSAFNHHFLGNLNDAWLLRTNEVGITIPKKTYRSDDVFSDVLADTQPPTAKTVYIEHRRLHWHLATEGQISELALTDDLFDEIDALSIRNPQRIKDGMDLRSEMWGRNDKGVIAYVSDATSLARHSSDGLAHQGYQEYGTETYSEMVRDLTAALAERKKERVTYSCEVGPLTADQAVKLIPGSQINCTGAVWRLNNSTQRLARVELIYRNSEEGKSFLARLELGYPIRLRRKPPKTHRYADPRPPFVPNSPCDDITDTFERADSIFHGPILGWDDAGFSDFGPAWLPGYGHIANDQMAFDSQGDNDTGYETLDSVMPFPSFGTFRIENNSWTEYVGFSVLLNDGILAEARWTQYTGMDPLDALLVVSLDDGVNRRAETVIPVDGIPTSMTWEIQPTGITVVTGLTSVTTLVADASPAPLPRLRTARDFTFIAKTAGGGSAVFDSLDITGMGCTPDKNQPTVWQIVGIGDSLTTTFHTPDAYIPGTLEVRVDGVPIINGLVEGDPALGTFQIDFAPLDAIGDAGAEIVRARYTAA